MITIIIIPLIFVNFSLRLLRGTSCVGCQVSPTSISGDHDDHDDYEKIYVDDLLIYFLDDFFMREYPRDNKISHIDAADSFEEVINHPQE